MLRSCKTELKPTPEQAIIIRKTIGTCRYVSNMFIDHNKTRYENNEPYMSAKQFSVWLNNEYLPEHPDESWIKEVSSKSVKQALENTHQAFLKFFKGTSGYPRYKKKKNDQDVKMYFVRNDAKHYIDVERHRIKIPTLGWVRLKEKGYIPTLKSGVIIRSGTVSQKADRYYVSVLYDDERDNIMKSAPALSEGIGIDLGIKELAVLSDGSVFGNINKTSKVRRLEKRLRRAQRCLSRKYEARKQRIDECGEGGDCRNIDKQRVIVQRLFKRLDNIRSDYLSKVVSEVVRTKPAFITIEDLNVSGMMKNKHLAKAIQEQRLREFRDRLEWKCREYGVELRVVDRFYPSSKTCHACGCKRDDLKLSDRVFACGECGARVDRDFNASLNLRDAGVFTVVVGASG